MDCVRRTACAGIEKKCGGINETGGCGGESSGGTSGTSGSSSAAIASCQTQCDSINFCNCSSTAGPSSCRDKCTSAAATARDTFTSCSQSSGTDCAKKKEC